MMGDVRAFLSLWSDRTGTAGAEMALVTPLLMIIMFGAFDLGNYFYSQHVVVKAVRDGARYAARQGFGHYSCPTGSATGTVVDAAGVTAATLQTNVSDVTRTGKLHPVATDSKDSPRLAYWTTTYDSPNTAVNLAVKCTPITNYSGIYKGAPGGVPTVRVSADVKYQSLFNTIGFNATTLYMRAESEAAVMGL
ncbi:TadE/TadG family type IV pilus assembly protein [Aquisediminimonas sediminicola]|uniref:TadE/TadG family type IV pilus assembly protein n=1 Tax=Alteraquisediminimonas sediminicola TaxID=2676787 RepID=UPI001FEA937A|nr:TadE family protein [Aquisediminimonas sediminicola]